MFHDAGFVLFGIFGILGTFVIKTIRKYQLFLAFVTVKFFPGAILIGCFSIFLIV